MNPGAEPRTSPVPRPSGLALLNRVDYRLVQTPAEKDSVYLMRYRAYLHGGLISPSDSGRIIDPYDDAPNAWIFGIYLDGALCSSIRLHVLTSESRMSYTTQLFGDVLDSRLDQGEIFVDPARFAADPETAKLFPELPYVTLRLAYLACDHFNADTGLAMVRTDHQAFYRRVFFHETVSEPRAFPGWHSKQVVLMASDFRELRERVLARFPIMRSTVFERQKLFDRNKGQLPPLVNLLECPSMQAGISPTA
jgi:hypothetical protein